MGEEAGGWGKVRGRGETGRNQNTTDDLDLLHSDGERAKKVLTADHCSDGGNYLGFYSCGSFIFFRRQAS